MAAAAPAPSPDGSPFGEPQVDFNDVFSLRRPKDARAGLASGVKSIAKGVLGGAAGLFAAPIVGAQQEGVKGFAKGLASGVVGAVVLPVAGVGVGTVQIVRGVMNQPEALVQQAQGRLWDQERREWVEKGALVALEPPKSKAGAYRRPTTGDDYYAILQVPHDATPEQIKKQYYLLARRWHPDKNPGDAGAHEKFQKLGEAYQVLANEELRKRYDENGAEGLDVNFMDGAEFFNMLFGSDCFEHLVGELLIAAAARDGGELSTSGLSNELKREQGVRVQKLCVNLKALLMRYTKGDEAGFKLAMEQEAARLVKASFGETMVHTIGKLYEAQADIYGGTFFGGTMAKFRLQQDSMRSHLQAASAAIKVYAKQQEIEAWQRRQDKEAAAAKAAAVAEAAAAKAAAEAEAAKAAADAKDPNADAAADAAGQDGAGKGSESRERSSGLPDKAAAVAHVQLQQGAGSSSQPSQQAEGAGPSGADAAAGRAQPGAASGNTTTPAAAAQPAGPSPQALLERQKLEEAALPLMLEAMWAANVLDIQATLKKVCKFVLTEDGVKKPELAARAAGLKLLGQIFQAAVAPESAVPADARKQMEEAMLKVVQKRAQQEHEEDDDAT